MVKAKRVNPEDYPEDVEMQQEVAAYLMHHMVRKLSEENGGKEITSSDMENVLAMMVQSYLEKVGSLVDAEDVSKLADNIAFNMIGMVTPYLSATTMHRMVDRAQQMWAKHKEKHGDV